MSDSSRPHGPQPTRLLCPWDFPSKSTGVGCHFLLQCMKMKSESEVAQSCPTLRNPMDCSPPGSSVYGIFQARVLEWGAIAFSMCMYVYTNICVCALIHRIMQVEKGSMISSFEYNEAPHSSTLAWKIPWTEEPGRLQSMGSRRVGHD